MKKYKIIISLVFIFNISFSQNINYSISSIHDSLKEDANVVVRYSNYELVINDIGSATVTVKKVISIIKKNGETYADIEVDYDKFNEIKYFSEKIYNEDGSLFHKIKNKEINDISDFSSSLFSDNRKKFIKRPALKPPYTIEYEYKIKQSGLYGIRSWLPIFDYNVSVEKAYFSIETPKNISFFTKDFNCNNIEIQSKIEDKKNIKVYSLNNNKAIKYETFSSFYDYFPIVKVRLSNFEYDGYKGNSDSWANLGKWENQLLIGQDIIPEQTKQEINDLIKDKQTDFEKAKLIYEYMQNKTRYVSIQVGIGGLKPFSAKTVDETGYGDCKALSNYTMSLLKIAGIKSYYTSVYAGTSFFDLQKDFPSHQSNHVIICLPNNNDTIWLECTSQTNPFGYIGTFTDDRDVLIIDENGEGKLAHTTVYPEEVNTQIRTANFILDETGNINGEINTEYSGLQYENVNRYLVLSKEEQKKKLDKRISIPNMKIEEFSFDEKKDLIPSITEIIKMNIQKYASTSSNRLFLAPNILNRSEYIPKKIENRKTNIIFRRGYIDIDTIKYKLPQNYKIEFIPKNIEIDTKFGKYSTQFKIEGKELIFTRKLSLHKGNFPPKDYSDLRKFYQTIYKNDKKTVVLVKE